MADTSDILDILSLFENRKLIIPWIGIEVFHGTGKAVKPHFRKGWDLLPLYIYCSWNLKYGEIGGNGFGGLL